jgi:cell cycle checkpoint protein
MYYPSSLRLWRQQEELGGLLDIWVSRVQRGELFGPISLPRKPLESKTGGVDTWRRTAAFVTETTSSSTGHTKEISDEPPQVLLGGGGSARYEMLLERLPYLQRILHKTPVPFGGSAATIRDIQKLTTFTGTGMIVATDSLDDDADEEPPVENEQWTTDRPGSNTPKKQRSIKFEKKKRIAKDVLETIAERDVRSLVLSDDDIED